MEKKKKIQWHPAFYSGIELELRDYRDSLEFITEFELSRKPLRMDMLIIKKNTDEIISSSFASIFRKYNVIEYKSPEDGLSIDDFYKTVGYALIYKGLSKKVNEIPLCDLTVSIFRDSYPREMFEQLRIDGATISKPSPGIYFVNRLFPIPVQVVITSQIKDDSCCALKILKKQAKINDIRRFLSETKKYKSQGDINNIDAILDVSFPINRASFGSIKEEDNMCEALRELFKDELEEKEQKGKLEGRLEERLESLKNLMKNMNINAGQAMDLLEIPESDRTSLLKML